jgi:hypothetical protein
MIEIFQKFCCCFGRNKGEPKFTQVSFYGLMPEDSHVDLGRCLFEIIRETNVEIKKEIINSFIKKTEEIDPYIKVRFDNYSDIKSIVELVKDNDIDNKKLWQNPYVKLYIKAFENYLKENKHTSIEENPSDENFSAFSNPLPTEIKNPSHPPKIFLSTTNTLLIGDTNYDDNINSHQAGLDM